MRHVLHDGRVPHGVRDDAPVVAHTDLRATRRTPLIRQIGRRRGYRITARTQLPHRTPPNDRGHCLSTNLTDRDDTTRCPPRTA